MKLLGLALIYTFALIGFACGQYSADQTLYYRDNIFHFSTLTTYSDSSCNNALSSKVLRVGNCVGGGNDFGIGFCAPNRSRNNVFYKCNSDSTCDLTGCQRFEAPLGRCVPNTYGNLTGGFITISCTEEFPYFSGNSLVYTIKNTCGNGNESYKIDFPQSNCNSGQNELIDCSGNQATVRTCQSADGSCQTCTSSDTLITNGENCLRNQESAYQTLRCGSSFKAPKGSAFSIVPQLFLIFATIALILA
eukprot:TRINITY_DN13987_c0_g1_i1.p1 TRINITY_DN13987_c0_g1~~TRINITY_DN13987_c0_g1_i1.p1  ORF type:complete len:248 (-),score=60.64 TRINITY_DN13987_c0_g1_i1:42-785(-)